MIARWMRFLLAVIAAVGTGAWDALYAWGNWSGYLEIANVTFWLVLATWAVNEDGTPAWWWLPLLSVIHEMAAFATAFGIPTSGGPSYGGNLDLWYGRLSTHWAGKYLAQFQEPAPNFPVLNLFTNAANYYWFVAPTFTIAYELLWRHHSRLARFPGTLYTTLALAGLVHRGRSHAIRGHVQKGLADLGLDRAFKGPHESLFISLFLSWAIIAYGWGLQYLGRPEKYLIFSWYLGFVTLLLAITLAYALMRNRLDSIKELLELDLGAALPPLIVSTVATFTALALVFRGSADLSRVTGEQWADLILLIVPAENWIFLFFFPHIFSFIWQLAGGRKPNYKAGIVAGVWGAVGAGLFHYRAYALNGYQMGFAVVFFLFMYMVAYLGEFRFPNKARWIPIAGLAATFPIHIGWDAYAYAYRGATFSVDPLVAVIAPPSEPLLALLLPAGAVLAACIYRVKWIRTGT